MTEEIIAKINADDEASFAPGTMGCHEALHMVSFLAGAVDSELCEHGAIQRNPKWLALAESARDALAKLYQGIGTEHLG